MNVLMFFACAIYIYTYMISLSLSQMHRWNEALIFQKMKRYIFAPWNTPLIPKFPGLPNPKQQKTILPQRLDGLLMRPSSCSYHRWHVAASLQDS